MLTKKALLNTCQLAVDQIARIAINFFLTPILVTHLGGAMFGIWQLIQKSSFQVAALDGRSSEVLKWVIASQQNNEDSVKKQRAIGSAIISLLFFSPLLLFSYFALIKLLPSFFHIAAELQLDVKITLAILALNALFMAIAAILEATIRGMNIAYKLLGIQALILIVGGICSAVAVIEGYGIQGVAGAQLVASFLFILSYLIVARLNILWLGVRKPTINEVRITLIRCFWYTLWAFISLWVFTGDVIVLGVFLPPETVSQYVLTMYVSQMMTIAILTAVSSILPGLAGIIGKGELGRAAELRRESFLYSWWLTLTICSLVIIFNQSFLNLWVGETHYAGDDINALIALCIMQLVFIRHDANILNLALDVRKKVLLGLLSSVVLLFLMIYLVPKYKILGLCFALILGRSILSITYPLVIRDFLKVKKKEFYFRRFIVTLLFIWICWKLSHHIIINSWGELILSGILTFIIIFVLTFVLGIDRLEKKIIFNRFRTLKK